MVAFTVIISGSHANAQGRGAGSGTASTEVVINCPVMMDVSRSNCSGIFISFDLHICWVLEAAYYLQASQ